MRFFPSARRRRLVVACCASPRWRSAPLAVPLANADDTLKDKQKQVQKQIGAGQADLEESSDGARRRRRWPC